MFYTVHKNSIPRALVRASLYLRAFIHNTGTFMEQTNIYSAVLYICYLQDFDILTSILCCVHNYIFTRSSTLNSKRSTVHHGMIGTERLKADNDNELTEKLLPSETAGRYDVLMLPFHL